MELQVEQHKKNTKVYCYCPHPHFLSRLICLVANNIPPKDSKVSLGTSYISPVLNIYYKVKGTMKFYYLGHISLFPSIQYTHALTTD